MVATYVLYLLLLGLLPYSVAFSMSFATGIGLSYLLNSRAVFKTQVSGAKRLAYPVVYLGQYLVSLAIVALLVEIAGVQPVFAPLISTALMVPITFLIMGRYFGVQANKAPGEV